MKVAINTDGLYTTQAGTARYIRGLLRGLRRTAPSGIEWFELAWPVENYSYQQPARALKTFYREMIWAKLLAPAKIRDSAATVLHSTAGWLIDPPEPVRCVATLHDLALIREPGRFRPWQRRAGRGRLESLTKASRIICISQFTADEAIACLGLPASKLEVVYNGCEFHPSEPTPVEEKPGAEVPSDFFLFVGSLEPGKNLALLREAWAMAEAEGRPLPPLLISGVRWEGVPGEGKPPAGWIYLGRQSDAAVVYLYRRARALVFPSKYEGFGLPVIESMALGTPVICSPVSSLKEVGGAAALFAELNPGSYLAAMRRILAEPALRQELVGKGRQWATNFSWDRCAAETAEIYRSAALS
jgi:alpha-1,3-rhamnosyl/mannosyltransferase